MRADAFLEGNIPTLKAAASDSFAGLQMIDVRMPEEFTGELGHLPGAKLVTLGEDLERFLKSIDPKTEIVFICRSGKRSASATMTALEMGFTSVYNMQGGMLACNQLGVKTER
ncbi:MAG: rhodanese-like domain-containing protein [Bacteriovoracaceae bacterium]|nr:rhodanese-like domain-containing protein [Bacteriovoracaceae bacterium]